ncbi:unnamed protein product [Meloidogyne enterolobii]|uniref:Uncharacterized protein n=1 Tax=Meloidogyne enterolobii TaxID=390850 RepID=A0ACB0YG44_MELEN
MSLEDGAISLFTQKFHYNIWPINLSYFSYSTKGNSKARPECMRFLVRLALLGVLFLLFILALSIHQKRIRKEFPEIIQKKNISVNKPSVNTFLIPVRPKGNSNQPTEEDKEARRLLQLFGGSSDDGIPVPAGHNPISGGGGGAFPQLETAIGAGLLFPIGRYPPGSVRGNAVRGQLTLNVAVVLIVSLLSIAVLITAICCVIVIALAMESATTIDECHNNNSSSNDFLLSRWPHLILPRPQIDEETGNPLTDDEMEDCEDVIDTENVNKCNQGQSWGQNKSDLEPLIEKGIERDKKWLRKNKSESHEVGRPNIFIV